MHLWDGESVLFVHETGDTHRLGKYPTAVISTLKECQYTFNEIADKCDVANNDQTELTQALNILCKLGLVQETFE